MSLIQDHPLRYALTNELHARPFPNLEYPAQVAFLAIKRAENAASRDRALDREHLIALLDWHGADHPAPKATHYYADLGPFWLKWEQHTEFVTYTAFVVGQNNRPFDHAEFSVFPDPWLETVPGQRLTSALIRVEKCMPDAQIARNVKDWFVPESVAVSSVLDQTAVIAGDFRIDPAGHLRFAVFPKKGMGSRRAGRIVQRLCEIETYKTMSMLGLARERLIGPQISQIGAELSEVMASLTNAETSVSAETTLERLLAMSVELENIQADAAFRFAATKAYEGIVTKRIEVLREERFEGRQTFGEFMTRRYDPAMRTVESAERQMLSVSARAIRAADLLRTKVDVMRQAQNQSLLQSMDRRADMQLRLQRTVEGLSVVAISYYAINLALYFLGTLPDVLGLTKPQFTTFLTPLIVLSVYFAIRRIRKHAE